MKKIYNKPVTVHTQVHVNTFMGGSPGPYIGGADGDISAENTFAPSFRDTGSDGGW